MSNQFNAEQARQLAEKGDTTHDAMLDEILAGIETAARNKSRSATFSFGKTEHNEALVDGVLDELTSRGFTSRCTLVSGTPYLYIEVNF